MSQIIRDLDRLEQIGRDIAALTAESKLLREHVAHSAEVKAAGDVNEDNPVDLLLRDKVVSIKKARGAKDYTVTFKPVTRLLDNESV